MCYHASVGATYQQLEDAYERPFDGDTFPSFTSKNDVVGFHLNGFNYPLMPVITSESKDLLQVFRWGLIPRWTKDIAASNEIRSKTLNAKSETFFDLPAFRESALQKRCIIPLSGFFEWQDRAEKTKIPFFIHPKHSALFSVAGIYQYWNNPVDQSLMRTFSILTTSANPLMANIHSKKRMPLILEKGGEQLWLDPTVSQNDIMNLCKPFNEVNMEAYTISGLVSSRKLNSNVPEVTKFQSYEQRDLFS